MGQSSSTKKLDTYKLQKQYLGQRDYIQRQRQYLQDYHQRQKDRLADLKIKYRQSKRNNYYIPDISSDHHITDYNLANDLLLIKELDIIPSEIIDNLYVWSLYQQDRDSYMANGIKLIYKLVTRLQHVGINIIDILGHKYSPLLYMFLIEFDEWLKYQTSDLSDELYCWNRLLDFCNVYLRVDNQLN